MRELLVTFRYLSQFLEAFGYLLERLCIEGNLVDAFAIRQCVFISI